MTLLGAELYSDRADLALGSFLADRVRGHALEGTIYDLKFTAVREA
jgi:hypothetical protein